MVDFARDEELPSEVRAQMANRLQGLAFSAEIFDKALEWAEEACRLEPIETYLANKSMVEEAMGNLAAAKTSIDAALQNPLQDSEAHTLEQAIDVYEALGDSEKVEALFAVLTAVDAERARVKYFMHNVQHAFTKRVKGGR